MLFRSGTPWIKTNPNYPQINAAEQLGREDSVFHFYQKLIRLRHENEIIVYGSYDLLSPEDPQLYAYTRTLDGQKLLCVCNLTGRPAEYELPAEFAAGRQLIAVGQPVREGNQVHLGPWDGFVLVNF